MVGRMEGRGAEEGVGGDGANKKARGWTRKMENRDAVKDM